MGGLSPKSTDKARPPQRWLWKYDNENDLVYCSKCGLGTPLHGNLPLCPVFCPHCGEDMRERFSAENGSERKKKMTNADRIRNMTDEELVEMVDIRVCRILKPDGKGCPKGFYFGKCDKCVLKWLKQEVEEHTGSKTM